jgi:lipopolysaccharide export system protein LptC
MSPLAFAEIGTGDVPTDIMTDYRNDTLEEDPPAPVARARYNPSRARDEGAFDKAAKHSRLVRRLKFVLPTLAIVAVLAVWATARVIPGDLASLVAISGIDVKSNSVVMQKPHISGFEGTRRAYEVKADTAVQSLDDPKVVTFKTIVGHFGLDEAGVATVDAGVGVYNGNTNTLVLKDGINMQTTNGYTGKFMEANVDLGKGTLTSTQPLELTTAEGSIHANAVTVTDRGKRLAFSNGVSVTYLPSGDLVTPSGATTSP